MTVRDDLPGIPFADGAPYQRCDVAFSPSTGRVWTLLADDSEPWAGTMANGKDWDWYGAGDFPADTRLLVRAGRLVTPPPAYDPAMALPGDVVTGTRGTFMYAPYRSSDATPWAGSDGDRYNAVDLPSEPVLIVRRGKPVTGV